MMLEFHSGGRRVSADEFVASLKREAIESAMRELEERAYGAAASILDPETGKHPSVFVRRTGDTSFVISTRGSAAFARELEKRLGVEQGSIASMTEQLKASVPQVYLAHASEDHEVLARPLAERMMAEGIEVWLDEWEIGSGESLRRKMEEGLSGCTHFVVLLTRNALGKPWVETEIDAGFVRAVEGQSKFIGVRVGVAIDQLSPFLRARRCPSVQLDNDAEIAALIADIHGISRKPARGPAPSYAKTVPEGLKAWSVSAVAVAEYLVRSSKHGTKFDPQVRVSGLAEILKMPEEDVRLGKLDLLDAGLIEESKERGSDRFWPLIGLFVEFDRHFLDFDNEQDAAALANYLVSEKIEQIGIAELAQKFPEWSPRRLNSALNYLEDAKIINATHARGEGPWTMFLLWVTDRTRRFARERG